jgi:hypothetical protein
MKRLSLIASAAVIVLANLLALLHAQRNRTGSTEADLKLTQRELRYYKDSAPDDSGVSLNLQWIDPNAHFFSDQENPAAWLDETKLRSLGFACSVSAASPDAGNYYKRQRPRRVFVALEYDGPAWRAWAERYERARANPRAGVQPGDSTDAALDFSRLVAIDADLNPLKLRARYPDRQAVLVVPAVVSITWVPADSGTRPEPKRSARLTGNIQIPSSIHVPRPFSDEFRHLTKNPSGPSNHKPVYRVHIGYGALLEPWVVGVDFQR